MPPADTTTRRPAMSPRFPRTSLRWPTMVSGSSIRPGPMMPVASLPEAGPTMCAPRASRRRRFSCVAGWPYMFTFIAGAMTRGAAVASAVAVSRLSEMPSASLAMVLAVAGAMTMASARVARSMWPTCSSVGASNMSVNTGRWVRAAKVTVEMRRAALSVRMTSTMAPCCVSFDARSAALYAAMPPVTPSTTRRFSRGRNRGVCAVVPVTGSLPSGVRALAAGNVRLGVHVVGDPEADECEVCVDVGEDVGVVRDEGGEAAGGDDGEGGVVGGRAGGDEFVAESLDHAFDEADEAVDEAGLRGFDGAVADDPRRRGELDAAELRCAFVECVCGAGESGGQGSAQVFAVGCDGVEDGGGAEVDHDDGAVVQGVGGQGIYDTVGAHILGAVVVDPDARARAGADDEGVDAGGLSDG